MHANVIHQSLTWFFNKYIFPHFFNLCVSFLLTMYLDALDFCDFDDEVLARVWL